MQKISAYYKSGFVALFMITVINSNAQQEFTLTTTNANISGYRAFIDLPGLINNPAAIILATPLGNTKTLSPHPTGAYYNQSKWSIINLDQAGMSAGLTFRVQYFLQPGPNQFVHLITNQNTPTYNASYLDHPALNNNPAAQVSIFQNWAPSVRGGNYDRYESAALYSTAEKKWYISNTGGQPLENPSAYNIIINTGSPTFINPNADKDINTNIKTPVSPSANVNAGGDLSGTYPNPTVIGLQGKPLSNVAPNIGQILKWNGTTWEPGSDNVGTTGPTPTNAMQTFFKNADEWSPTLSNSEEYYYVNHKYTITVAVNSRLIISGNFFVQSGACLVCQPAYSILSLYINTVFKSNLVESWTAPGSKENTSVSNYMIDVAPGTYIIQFKIAHVRLDNSPPTTHYARSSSIIVLPL